MKSEDIIEQKTYNIKVDSVPRKKRPDLIITKQKTKVVKPRWALNIS